MLNSDALFSDQCCSAAVPSMNLTKAPVFSPSEDHTSDFFQLRSLDMLPAEGLSEGEFWGLFSRCAVRKNFMTTRTIPYHRCPIPSGQYIFNFTRRHSTCSKADIYSQILRAANPTRRPLKILTSYGFLMFTTPARLQALPRMFLGKFFTHAWNVVDI